MSLVIIWSVVEVTYRLGFDRPATGGWVALSYAIDVLFLLDVLVTFRTALLTRNGVVVARPGKVAISYLQARSTTIATGLHACFARLISGILEVNVCLSRPWTRPFINSAEKFPLDIFTN